MGPQAEAEPPLGRARAAALGPYGRAPHHIRSSQLRRGLMAVRRRPLTREENMMVHMVNQAVGQAFINHASIMANSVHNAVLKMLQEGGSLGFMGPAYQ